MVAALAHRGPDDRGYFVGDGAAIGMTRLAIIDLASGQQPKEAAGGRLQAVFNGEIYNFRELRQSLVQGGHRFTSRSDSEVVVRAFEEWGDGAFGRMHGMFAIAVWDRASRRLTLARDQVGKKPLYVWDAGAGLAFASEPKALAVLGSLPGIDHQAFTEYLHFGYVPAPRSIWEGVTKVQPGTTVTFDGARRRARRFWRLEPAEPAERAGPAVDAAGAVAELERRIDAAVERRLVADVDVGVLLSGGIDSSIVTSAAAARHPAIHTFTVAFDDPSLDESAPARAVADALGTTHHQALVTGDDALAVVDDLPSVYDEPFADASAVPTLLISRFAAQHVKVVLGGDGGDELFDGYDRYRSFARMLALRRAVPPPLQPLGRALACVPVDAVSRAGNMMDRLGPTPAVTYRNLVGIVPPTMLRDLLGTPPDLRSTTARIEEAFVAGTAAGPRLADFDTYLPDDILVKVDRASMSTGLEVRAPFLDLELVEWASRLPDSVVGPPGAKALPRALLASKVAASVVDRPKQGFTVPLDRWLLGPLRPVLDDVLSPSSLAGHGLVRPAAVERLVDALEAGRRFAARPLWSLVMFQLWHRRWAVSGAATPPATSAAPDQAG